MVGFRMKFDVEKCREMKCREEKSCTPVYNTLLDNLVAKDLRAFVEITT